MSFFLLCTTALACYQHADHAFASTFCFFTKYLRIHSINKHSRSNLLVRKCNQGESTHADTFKKRHIRFDLINNALTNVQKRSSVYFHFRYIPFDCTGMWEIHVILNKLLLDFFVLFSCEWFMKRIAFFAFVFWVTRLVSDISNHLVFSRYKCQILVLTY